MERESFLLPDKIHEIRHQFIASIAPSMDIHGVSETNGRLYGTMLFAKKPMTLDDMSEALGMSKMSMSTGVRGLMKAGLVKRVWEKGVRKDLYQTNDDWYQSFVSIFIKRWRPSIEINRQAALQAKHALVRLQSEVSDPQWIEQIDEDIMFIKEILRYYTWVEEVIYLFECGAIYDIVPLPDP